MASTKAIALSAILAATLGSSAGATAVLAADAVPASGPGRWAPSRSAAGPRGAPARLHSASPVGRPQGLANAQHRQRQLQHAALLKRQHLLESSQRGTHKSNSKS